MSFWWIRQVGADFHPCHNSLSPMPRPNRLLGRTMELLISSILSNGAGNGIRQEDVNNGKDDGLLSTSVERNMPGAPRSLSSIDAERDLPNNYKARPGLSSSIYAGAEWPARPTLAPASPSPNCKKQVVLAADLVSDGGVVSGRRKNAGEVVQAPGALLVSPEVSEWGGMADGTENENRLVAEDWLDAAHALLDTVADP